MGVKYLTYHHEEINARLPFTINKEKLSKYKDKYAEIGQGILKSIGVDGSTFLHSYTSSEYDIMQNSKIIADRILSHVEKIIAFFNLFEKQDRDDTIILHIVVDSKPPLPKNRREVKSNNNNTDYYTALSPEDKQTLHQNMLKIIQSRVDRENGKWEADLKPKKSSGDDREENITATENNANPYTILSNEEKDSLHENVIEKIENYIKRRTFIKLLSNIKEKDRKEGEIKLFSFCQEINEKYHYDPCIRNVIVSSDSDVCAMMNFHSDRSLVIVSNIVGRLYISSHALICRALDMTPRELFAYTLLHFVYFGSDYNLGLVSSPTESKQKIIYQSVKAKIENINSIGKSFVRKRKRKTIQQYLQERTSNQDEDENNEEGETFLKKFKDKLIIEALCAAKYYAHLGDEIFLTDFSPLLYLKSDSRVLIPFVEF